MAKQARGLPDSFKLNVSPAALGKPVTLGDYLDEELPTPRPRVATLVKGPSVSSLPTVPVVTEPIMFPAAPSSAAVEGELGAAVLPEPRGEASRAVPAVPTASTAPPARLATPKPQRLSTSVPRKQINMAPETIAMVEQLLGYVQTYGVQKDLKGSELFHGLVLALFEAREHIDLARVQPRGRWGTPTAQALPIALKTAFQKAISSYLQEREP